MIKLSLHNRTDTMAKLASEKGFALLSPERGEIVNDPYITGYSFLKITRIGAGIKDIITSDFGYLLESTFKEFQGINDLDLNTLSITGGFTDNEHHYPSEMNMGTYEITLKFQERTGNVYRRPFQQWMTGIRNPKTGLYSLPGDYNKLNYTMDVMYIVTNPSIGSQDPDTRERSVEAAYFYTGLFPKRLPLNHHNFTTGGHDFVEIDIPFAAEQHIGVHVDEFARKLVKETKEHSIYWRIHNTNYLGEGYMSEAKLNINPFEDAPQDDVDNVDDVGSNSNDSNWG